MVWLVSSLDGQFPYVVQSKTKVYSVSLVLQFGSLLGYDTGDKQSKQEGWLSPTERVSAG